MNGLHFPLQLKFQLSLPLYMPRFNWFCLALLYIQQLLSLLICQLTFQLHSPYSLARQNLNVKSYFNFIQFFHLNWTFSFFLSQLYFDLHSHFFHYFNYFTCLYRKVTTTSCYVMLIWAFVHIFGTASLIKCGINRACFVTLCLLQWPDSILIQYNTFFLSSFDQF